MNRRTAIRECKALWKTILEGKYRNKNEALAFPEFAHIRKYLWHCPLCQYELEKKKNKCRNHCDHCPLNTQNNDGILLPMRCEQAGVSWLYNPKQFAAEVMKLKVHGK